MQPSDRDKSHTEPRVPDIVMAAQNPDAWDMVIDDFFDYAISASKINGCEDGDAATLGDRPVPTVPRTWDAGNAANPRRATTSSLSPSDNGSPVMDLPDQGHVSPAGVPMQLIWSTGDRPAFLAGPILLINTTKNRARDAG